MKLKRFAFAGVAIWVLLARGDQLSRAGDPTTAAQVDAAIAAVEDNADADADADEEDVALPLPGLWASYRVEGVARVERFEPAAALALEPGQSPDLRLTAEGWTVRWEGLLDVQQPGVYHFSAITTGALAIEVDGNIVLEAASPAKTTAGSGRIDPGTKLEVGYHPITIDFTPDGPGAGLEILWQSETLALERIPGFALLHSPKVQREPDNFLAGRLAVEEHSCLACHQATDDAPAAKLLAQRGGPNLRTVGARLDAGWIYHWLGDPQAWRAGTVMPKLFSDDRPGEVERYAVASVLAALSGESAAEKKAPEPSAPGQVAAGKALYERVGCLACHDAAPEAGATAPLKLHDLGKKQSVETLAAYLADPSANDPCTRMPSMGLSTEECGALAAYLTAHDADDAGSFDLPTRPTADEVAAALEKLPATDTNAADTSPASGDEQLAELGRRVISARRCANCHELPASLTNGAPDDTRARLAARPAEKSFAQIAHAPGGGCLATNVAGGAAPRFGASLDRQAAQSFLHEAVAAPGTPDPAQQARLAIARFRCTACHERDGRGGLSDDLYALLTTNQTEAEAELVRPPSLTGVARKLKTAALAGVLAGDERSRPWMALRMPHFTKPEMQALVGQLTVTDGTRSDDVTAPPAAIDTNDSALAEAGRTLIGSRGFGCIKCHDVRGIPSGGTRGPDLARVTRRVRHDWFNHWMTDPQRLEPGTRMPTVFLSGKSPYTDVLDGDPDRQRLAMWVYLSAGEELALPEGIESPDVVTSAGPMAPGRPWVLRTFLPELSPRSIAVHFGCDVHAAFDAQNCRLAYAWQGGFVDLAASWTHRGGREAALLGKVFWKSPPGFPWAIALDGEDAPPDFAARATDIELGAPAPPTEGQPVRRLHFLGYRLPPRDAAALAGPTFRYQFKLPTGEQATFAETVSPLETDDSVGLLREIEITGPPGAIAMLNCAESAQASRQHGESTVAALPPLVSCQDQLGTELLAVRESPAKTSWQTSAGDKRIVLAIPLDAADGAARLVLAMLRPKDDSPSGLERLIEVETSARRRSE
ncbi:MAG: c-type cytochrome [Pirellulales bacterium]